MGAREMGHVRDRLVVTTRIADDFARNAMFLNARGEAFTDGIND